MRGKEMEERDREEIVGQGGEEREGWGREGYGERERGRGRGKKVR